MKTKCLAVGIILLFVGTCITPATLWINPVDSNGKNPPEKERSLFQKGINVTFTYPEKWIYFNDHKILPFFVPLVLCGNITIEVVVSNGSGLDRVEFYVNDVLQETVYGFQGLVYEWYLSWEPFSKLNFKVIAYSFNETASDEIMIWRLFR